METLSEDQRIQPSSGGDAFSPDVTTLAKAALRDKTGRPSAKAVVDALLQAEKATKQQRLSYPLELLLGDWRLCFTAPRQAHLRSGKALGRGFYVPQIAPAGISFGSQTATSEIGQLVISNQIRFGPLLLKLTGPAQYSGKKNLLVFDFTHIQLSLLGRAFYSGKFGGGKAATIDSEDQSIAKLPFFAFFLVTEDFIAARGRGGGLALWSKRMSEK